MAGDDATEGCQQIRVRIDLSLVSYHIVIASYSLAMTRRRRSGQGSLPCSTPLLDIKPYVPKFDQRKTARIGWLKNKINGIPIISDDGRFAC